MKAFGFPGQGSQRPGMGGGALFDAFPELTEQASDLLGYSIRSLCLDDPRKELDQTRFTQPAIYVVNALSYLRRIQRGDAAPVLFAGHSLGEFNALTAAGCFDFETGLRLVKKRGELMGQVTGGGMAAVMNLSREKIEAILREQGIDGVDIAIHNAPSQNVLAGLQSDLARLEAPLEAAGGMFYPLKTSGAFHSRYMRPVADEFRAFLGTVSIAPLRTPVLANVSARPYANADVVNHLVEQLTQPVLWTETVEYLLGIEGLEFEEVGDSDVLTKLVQRVRRGFVAPATSTPLPVIENVPAAPAALAPSEPAAAAPRSPADKVAAWNAAYPIGTRVRASRATEAALATRTTALVLFGHRAAVYLQGYNGYFDLDELQVV
ncbi:ACP S-malonyltransferase [Burkholderia gladioli]|uniref:[acyl-carrier-protein] S-malonyltransferase n=1 Tax=Burkholderia gladioli (strain BSR3) TaxID=999541 RepID=F2LA11_BURGS|nr:ACP S-malonyltransferase [Burkholderia gladioli]AEA60795.1 malonyl CoA-acyl carrier protein transacylase [Burkholderia gladioli BSR3]MBW5280804.1 ACP S-malonyltransferase [Burkholderia gladioli]